MKIVLLYLTLLSSNQLISQILINDNDILGDSHPSEDNSRLALFHYLGVENELILHQYNFANMNSNVFNYSFGVNYYFNFINEYGTIKYNNFAIKARTLSEYKGTYRGTTYPYLKFGYRYSLAINSKERRTENNIQFENTVNYHSNVFNINLYQSIFWIRGVGRFFLFAGYCYHSLNNTSSIISVAENLNKEDFTLSGYEKTNVNYIKKKHLPLTNLNKLSFGLETYFNIKIADKWNDRYRFDFLNEFNYLRLGINFNTNYNLNYKENNLIPLDYSLNLNLSYPLPLFNYRTKYE